MAEYGVMGNARRLQGAFVDSAGAPVEPDGDVMLRIYHSQDLTPVVEHVISKAAALSLGVYAYWYTNPNVPSYEYEFSAVVDGKPEVDRATINLRRSSSR